MNIIMRVSQLACVAVLACAIQAGPASAAEQAVENNPIALKVRTALNNNAAVVSSNYSVTATGGEVHLGGVVSNEFEMQQALATAKKVPGVTSVVNDIAVATTVNTK